MAEVSDRRKILQDLAALFEAIGKDPDNPDARGTYHVSIEIGVCGTESILRNTMPCIQIIDSKEVNRIVKVPSSSAMNAGEIIEGTVSYTLTPLIRLVEGVDDNPDARKRHGPEPHAQVDAHIQQIKAVHDSNQSFGNCDIWRMPSNETIYDATGYIAEVYFENQLDVYASFTRE